VASQFAVKMQERTPGETGHGNLRKGVYQCSCGAGTPARCFFILPLVLIFPASKLKDQGQGSGRGRPLYTI